MLTTASIHNDILDRQMGECVGSITLRCLIPVAARTAAAFLLGLRVRILPGAWMYVPCVCCVLSGRVLCDELITHQEECY